MPSSRFSELFCTLRTALSINEIYHTDTRRRTVLTAIFQANPGKPHALMSTTTAKGFWCVSTDRIPFLSPKQQRQSTEGNYDNTAL